MKPNRRYLTQHRFQRITLWTLALLTWFAAILSNNAAVSPRQQRQRFDISLPWLANLVGQLLIIRAAQVARVRRTRPIRTWRHGRDLRPSNLQRSVLGARARRALKRKDIRAWITQLIHVLRTLDTHAAELAQRFRRRLTRLVRNWSPIMPAPLHLGPPAPRPACTDSS